MFDEQGNLTRTWIVFFEQLASREQGWSEEDAGELKATFGIVAPLTVEDDLTNHFISRSSGRFTNLVANAKVAPTGSDAWIDIEKSSNEGSAWGTIFREGHIVLPAGDTTRLEWGADAFVEGAAGTIDVGDFLRINCYQIGSDNPGAEIEFVLRWE